MTSAETPRCAIVVCHPKSDSFCAAMAQQARAAAEDRGYEVVVRDLYAMAFDPVLHARDIALKDSGNRPAPDVEQELQILDNPAVVIMVYPIWFGSAPGLLKGYIERVLGAGFGGPGTVPLPASARPRLLLTIASSGASSSWIAQKGIAASAGRIFGAYLAGALAIPRAEHIAVDNIIPTMSPSRAKAVLEKVGQTVRKHLPDANGAPPIAEAHWGTLPSPTA